MAGVIYLVYYRVVSLTVMQLRNQSDCFTCTVAQSKLVSKPHHCWPRESENPVQGHCADEDLPSHVECGRPGQTTGNSTVAPSKIEQDIQ